MGVADLDGGRQLAVFDSERDRLVPIEDVAYPADGVGLAFIPNAWRRPRAEFFPILTPSLVRMGEAVYSFGHNALGGTADAMRYGYFAGKIVIINQTTRNGVRAAELILPYPVIEELSGSPRPDVSQRAKLVGVCHANEAQRILAMELVEVETGGGRYRETLHRQVEFGLAYHCLTAVEFLQSLGLGDFEVTDRHVAIPGLA